MKTMKIAVALCCTLALAVSCGRGELSRKQAEKMIERSPDFKGILPFKPDVTRRIQRVTGVRHEGNRALPT